MRWPRQSDCQLRLLRSLGLAPWQALVFLALLAGAGVVGMVGE